ncbi:MAG: aryl sulfotransferase, partial [Rhodospirillaceae bacterium]|nr:aryl sulfotransferase [Rhodospirillaceae bacterium]
MLHNKLELVSHNPDKAFSGYTIFTPLGQTSTYLINMKGEVAHEWKLPTMAGNYAYLLPNGNLLAAQKTLEGPATFPGKGGQLIEMDWDGNILWEYTDHMQHHDFRRLENGNTIYGAWEIMPKEAAARVQGGRPNTEHENGIYSDVVKEIDPDGNLVWDWRISRDVEIEKYPLCPIEHRKEFGHINSMQKLENGDVLISCRNNHLVAIIDHETKDFSWSMCDMKLGHQHDATMLENGNILIFVNGAHSVYGGPNFGSRIHEIDPKTKEVVWEYKGAPPYTFHSPFISGMERLPNGNTLICEGQWGRLFEVTPESEIVWDYVSPYFNGKGVPYADGNFVFRCYRY